MEKRSPLYTSEPEETPMGSMYQSLWRCVDMLYGMNVDWLKWI